MGIFGSKARYPVLCCANTSSQFLILKEWGQLVDSVEGDAVTVIF